MVNLNFIGWTAVIASVLTFKLAYEMAGTRGKQWRFFGFLILGSASVPAVMCATYYLHVLPEWAWFYELRSWRGSEFMVLPMGAACGCLAALLPRKIVILPLLASTAIASAPHLKPLFVPLPAEQIADVWSGDACLQSTPSTCGPASIATILRSLGVPATERQIASKAFTYAGGTEAWYLARFARSQGLTSRFDFRPGLPKDLKLPAMIGVKLGNFGHFIPVLARDGNRITIADPLSGVESIELETLARNYQLTGFHLSISRD